MAKAGSVRDRAADALRTALAPVVGVLTSPDVEAVCQRNALSFCELLLPFSQLSTEASIKDPANQQGSLLIRNLRVDFRDLRRDGFLHSGSVLPSVLAEAVREAAVGVRPEDGSPWYDAFRDSFMHWAEPTEQEFLRHYLASLLVVSSAHPDPLDQLTKLSQSQHAQQHTGQSAPSLAEVMGGPPFAATPKWFVPNIFKYYVLLHDVSEGDDKKAESVYQSMKMTYGAHACHLLRINSISKSAGAAPEASFPDPWRKMLEKKYRGVEKGIKRAKTLATESEIGGSFGEPDSPKGHHDLETVSSAVNLAELAAAQEPLTNGGAPGGGDVAGATIVDLSSAVNSTIPPADALSPAHTPAPRAYRSESIPNALSNNDLTTLANNSEDQSASAPAPGVSSTGTWENIHFHSDYGEKRWKDPLHPALGQALSASDRDRVKIFVQEFSTRGLLGFVERQMRLLNEQVVSRRGIHKSIFGVKIFGRGGNAPYSGNAPPAGASATPAVTYTMESGEMQMRRLADLCFLFQNYQRAFDLYQTMKKEFQGDGAWLYHAGALEMAAVCAFMLGPAHFSRPYPHHYMDNAITTYMNTCGRPMQAIRAALLSAEILGALEMHNETASLFIRMTSGDSDLCSALFLEQASRAFKRVHMDRKYALHLILAGHRYNKAADKELALACYLLAGEVYRDKGWGLAEDHIYYTIGHLSQALSDSKQALDACAELLHADSLQYPTQQEQFFRDYLRILKAERSKGSGNEAPIQLSLPKFDPQNVRVYYGGIPEEFEEISSELDQTEMAGPSNGESLWRILEERCCDYLIAQPSGADQRKNQNRGGSPGSIPLASPVGDRRYTDNSKPTEVPAGEVMVVVLPMSNPLEVPIAVMNPQLEWNVDGRDSVTGFSPGPAQNVVLRPLESKTLRLGLTVGGCEGAKLSLTGVRFGLAPCARMGDGESASLAPDPSLMAQGRVPLKTRGKRLNNSKEQKMGVFYGPDYRLNPIIGSARPLMKLDLSPRYPAGHGANVLDCLAGEIISYTLRISNASVANDPAESALADVVLAATPDAAVCVTGQTGLVESERRKSGEGEGMVHELMSARKGAPLGNGQSREWTVWVRAPDCNGEKTERLQSAKLLFAYHGGNKEKFRHRISKRTVSFRSHPSLVVKAECSDNARGGGSEGGCLLVLSCLNGNRPNDSHIAEIQVIRVTLLSRGERQFKIDSLLSPRNEIKLNPLERENVCLLLSPSNVDAGMNISEEWLFPPGVSPPDPAGNPGHFDRGVFPWPPAVGSLSTETGTKISVLYKAHIVNSEGDVRTVYGEQWCEVPIKRPSAQTPSTNIQASESKNASQNKAELTLAVEKPILEHDFLSERLCELTVKGSLILRDKVEGADPGKYSATVKCFSGPSDDARLYFRGGSTCPPAVYSRKTLWNFSELAPGSSREFELRAIFSSPGIFDVGGVSAVVTEAATKSEVKLAAPSKYVTIMDKVS